MSEQAKNNELVEFLKMVADNLMYGRYEVQQDWAVDLHDIITVDGEGWTLTINKDDLEVQK